VLTTDTGESFNLENFYDKFPIINSKPYEIKNFEPRLVNIKDSDLYLKNYISMSCKIPQSAGICYGILVVNVNIDALYKDIVDQFNVGGDSNLYVISEKNELVAHKSYGIRNGISQKNKENTLPDFEEMKRATASKKGHMISQYYSTRSRLFFILDRDVNGISNSKGMLSFILFTLFATIIGIVVVSIISFTTLKPLKNIIFKISGTTTKEHSNELEFIDEFLTDMKIENEDLKQRYKETFPFYKQKLLHDIFTSSLYNLSEIIKQLDNYNITLNNNNYVALVLEADFKDIEDNKPAVMRMFISDFIRKKLENNFGGFITEVENDKLGIAVNLPECSIKNDRLDEEQYSKIIQFAEEIINELRKESKIAAIIGIGPFVSSI
jgi:hypothetical protein